MKKLNTIRFALLVFMVFLFQGETFGEVLKLKSGTWIQGKILKKTKRAVIIDLGYDVLRIPTNEIAEITDKIQIQSQRAQTAQSQKQAGVNESQNSLYTAKHLEEVSTVEGVRDFGESVVVVRSAGGLGSGFVINKQGYVITNFHVVQGQKHINITRFKKNGGELKRIVHKNVRIVALDSFHDLAVLQVEDDIGPVSRPMVLNPGDNVTVGEKVFVVGNPLGLERTVTEGVVSHTGRNFSGKVFLQIDAAINPGNSGGPLLNNRGQVIGVINMGARQMQGLNFAIPIHHVKFLLNHIDSFAYNEAHPLSGYIYPFPPRNPQRNKKENKKENK
ncbi:MAG: serine protease [bacterium]|nr:serine protease [bacterium]